MHRSQPQSRSVVHSSPPPVIHPITVASGKTPPQVRADALERAFSAPPPPGKVYLLHGDPLVVPLAMNIAAHALCRDARIAVVDGGNQFNAHSIVRFVQHQRMNPDEALQRIFISRSFTCYQMEQAITRLLPSFLPRIGSTTAIILGMLDTLYDEQAPLREVRNILHRVLEALREMERNGVSLLICVREQNALPHERSRLLDTLKSGVDTIYRVEASSESLGLILEKGVLHDGTHSTDIHQHHRQRSCQLG